jgi:alkylated DNA repair dioxygenase AlkB
MADDDYTTPVLTEKSALRVYPLDEEWVSYLPHVAAEIDPLLDHHPEIKIMGRVAHQNRSVSFFSDTSIGYRYSGQLAASKPLTASLRTLLKAINSYFGAEFNGILINKYDGGEESIGKHSDDEKALDRTAGVVSLSVGAIRTFRIRNKATGAIVADVPTDPTKLLQMWGDFQKEFTHEIPVEKKVKGVRYSFTFRHHLE